MTNRLELNWKLDGFVDEQRYYCSETPFTPETLPSPKVTLLNSDRSYIDTAIELNKKYYVAVSSVKNSVEKVSVLSSAITSKHTAYFNLNNNLNDLHGGAPLALIEGVLAYESNALKLNGSSYVRRAATSAVHFGTGDFTVECEFKADDVASSVRDQVLINVYTQDAQPTWQLVLSPAGQLYVWVYGGSTGSVTLLQGTANLLNSEWHKAKWIRESGVSKLYIDDIQIASAADTRNYAMPVYLELGAQTYRPISQAYFFKGLIKNVGIAKQVI